MERLKSHFEIAELVAGFLEGKLSPDESERLERWINESEEHRQLWNRLTDPDYLETHLQYWKTKDFVEYQKQLGADIPHKKYLLRTGLRNGLKYAAVILALLMTGLAGWYIFNRSGGQHTGNGAYLTKVHIVPRGRVAQLVLGNGKVINLNDSLGETITEGDGTKVHNGGSMLHYSSVRRSNKDKLMYNTLIVPRGGEYRVTLSDGTKVWLNAASSLRYPIQFGDGERKVFLSGEGYFEVAKNEQHPFKVMAGETAVVVLGTKFNISAYTDDPEKRVTLAEGAVRINSVNQTDGEKNVLLKPGYEALIKSNDDDIRVEKANVESVLAWKNGMFIFDGESLGSLMRKLSRWYNVDVKYENGIDTLFHFTGRIKRYENITGILHLIELTGKVKFVLVGNKLEIKSK